MNENENAGILVVVWWEDRLSFLVVWLVRYLSLRVLTQRKPLG